MKRLLLICLVIASVSLSVSARQRMNTVSIDSTTVSIPLNDGTKTIFLTSNAMTSIVYGYNAGICLDTLRIKAGTSYTIYVGGRDSLRVERPYPTMMTWIKNPSFEQIQGGYMNEFSKACPYAHGDTLASGQTSMGYSTTQANADTDHPGYCNNFQSCMVTGYGTSVNVRLLVKVYYRTYLIAQIEVPRSVVFETTAWTFDSLSVTTLGNFEYASYSVSWNHGSF